MLALAGSRGTSFTLVGGKSRVWQHTGKLEELVVEDGTVSECFYFLSKISDKILIWE